MAFPAAMNICNLSSGKKYIMNCLKPILIFIHTPAGLKKQKREYNKFAYELGVQEIFLLETLYIAENDINYT
jgi:hypothetical protein